MTDDFERIENFLAEGFEKELFRACVNNLEDTESKLRVNNFSYAVRELVRNIMSRLASDEDIRNCEWWLQERYSKQQDREKNKSEHGIYRAERMRYSIQGGLDNAYVAEELGIDINEDIKRLKSAIDEMSKYTHIQENTFALDIDEQDTLVTEITTSLLNFLVMIDEFRGELFSRLEEKIFDATADHEMYQTILSLDAISGHYTTEGLGVDSQKISHIDSTFIYVTVQGTIDTTLQWGSNSDLRRGDGAVLEQNFPFSCEIQFLCSNPEEYELNADNFCVDTSEWYKNWIDEDYENEQGYINEQQSQ